MALVLLDPENYPEGLEIPEDMVLVQIDDTYPDEETADAAKTAFTNTTHPNIPMDGGKHAQWTNGEVFWMSIDSVIYLFAWYAIIGHP